MRKVGIGVIGCGVISKAYMTAMKQFSNIELRAVADMRSGPAEQRAKEFGVPGMRVDQMLKRNDVEIVVNLTVPLAHTDVSLAVLNAGKHVHSEKPLGVDMIEARKVMDLASRKNLRVGCAPDTFLGGGHQTARKLIDDGAIGQPIGGAAFFMYGGPESWHPNPEFLYQRGAGPVFDMGPYYVTTLINLLGPVKNVLSIGRNTLPKRKIGSGPRQGTEFTVEVLTYVTAILEFHSGAAVNFTVR